MNGKWIIDEKNCTINHWDKRITFTWVITAEGRAVLFAPANHGLEDAEYISLLKDAERAAAETVTSAKNKDGFKNTIKYREQHTSL